MELKKFIPNSKLVTPVTEIDRPAFPVIDAHNHLFEGFGGGWDKRPVNQLIEQLDQAGVVHYVDLDGGWGEEILNRHLEHFKASAPQRFTVFGGVDWSQWQVQGDRFPQWARKKNAALAV